METDDSSLDRALRLVMSFVILVERTIVHDAGCSGDELRVIMLLVMDEGATVTVLAIGDLAARIETLIEVQALLERDQIGIVRSGEFVTTVCADEFHNLILLDLRQARNEISSAASATLALCFSSMW